MVPFLRLSPGLSVPRLDAVPEGPSGSHPLPLRDPLAPERGTLGLCARVCEPAGAGGGGVSLLDFHSNCSCVTPLLPKV